MRHIRSQLCTVFLVATMLSSLAPSGSAEECVLKTEPPQRLDARFRLFRTENVWTNLMLDTKTGLLWQMSISTSQDVSPAKVPVNPKPLLNPGGAATAKDGRFTLYPTGNMWNFLLVDQEDGRTWQCQFSMKGSDGRFCQELPILQGAQ